MHARTWEVSRYAAMMELLPVMQSIMHVPEC